MIIQNSTLLNASIPRFPTIDPPPHHRPWPLKSSLRGVLRLFCFARSRHCNLMELLRCARNDNFVNDVISIFTKNSG